MSNSFSLSQKQVLDYLKNNFYSNFKSNNINSYKGGNKFDYPIWYTISFQWSKLQNLKKDIEEKKGESNE